MPGTVRSTRAARPRAHDSRRRTTGRRRPARIGTEATPGRGNEPTDLSARQLHRPRGLRRRGWLFGGDRRDGELDDVVRRRTRRADQRRSRGRRAGETGVVDAPGIAETPVGEPPGRAAAVADAGAGDLARHVQARFDPGRRERIVGDLSRARRRGRGDRGRRRGRGRRLRRPGSGLCRRRPAGAGPRAARPVHDHQGDHGDDHGGGDDGREHA